MLTRINMQFNKRLTGVWKYGVIGVAFLLMGAIFLYMTPNGRSSSLESVSRPFTNFMRQTFDFTNMTKDTLVPPNFVPDDNTKELSFKCKETFNKTLEDNLQVIKNYPRGDAGKYLFELGVNKSGPDILRTFPVFATAFNHQYYFSSRGLFKSIHDRFQVNPKYGRDVHLIVYDLGMTDLQYLRVKRNCNCEIRRFPFEKFPPHVMTLKTYAFKPIIVQMLLMEFGFVWWMDSSIRFTTNNVDQALIYVKRYGILHTVATDNRNACAMTKHTDTAMFAFLHEDRCKFRSFAEVWATTVMFHYDRISRVAVQAWAICALNKDCIAPPGTDKKLGCDYTKDYDGRCHRFDQSMLGIITRRIFHEQNRYPLDYSLNDIYRIQRGENVPYII